MTFKGVKFETILEIWQLVATSECLLKCYEAQLENKRKARDPDVNAWDVKVNLQRNFVQEIKSLQEELINNIEVLSASLSDVETQIFLKKFITGEDNEKIMDDLSISSSTLYRHYDNINVQLEGTTHGKELLEMLKNDC